VGIANPLSPVRIREGPLKLCDRSVKTLLAWHVSLGVFNNSRENKECRLIENPEQNNVGEISSRIARRVANLSGLIA